MVTTLEFRESIGSSGLDPDEQARALAALLELTELLGLAPSPSAARRLLVDHLALYLEADAVWFVSGDADKRQIVSAALPTVAVGARILPEDLGQLSDECRLGRRTLCAASSSRPQESAVLCHAGFLEAHEFAEVATVSLSPEAPLAPGESVMPAKTVRETRATLTVAWKTCPDHITRHCAFLRAARGVLPGLLRLLDRAERGWFSRATEGLRDWVSASTTRCAALLLALVAGVLSLPVPHPIACEVEIEPIARRFVAAPFDVRLERSWVKPGDTVAAGTLLARLDGRDLRVELAELAARIGRSAKERDGYLARHETGDAELARYDLEQLTARYELLTSRVTQLDVVAPVEGVVVAGDLQSSHGVPLKTGQTLFEIAPLESVRAVSLVPEWEFDRLTPTQSVEFHFDAVPRAAFSATVERVMPRAESRFDAWGFPFESTLDNPDGQLRPGMRGVAYVEQPRTTLAERLFRRPWRSLRLLTGW